MRDLKERSRYQNGKVEYTHRGVKVLSSVGSPEADLFILYPDRMFQYDIGFIPAGFEHRPDRISDLFYDTPGFWWLIMLANNISDPYEGLDVGDQIRIPKL